MVSDEKIKDRSSTFRAFTGLDQLEFEQLLTAFEAAWKTYIEDNYGNRQERRRMFGGGRKATLRTREDQLLFILVYCKLYPLQEVMGFLLGMSQRQANEWIHRLSPVRKMA